MKNIDERTEMLFDNLAKKQYLNVYTEKLGKVVEEEDKFVCYVDEKKLDFWNREAGQLHLCAFNNNESSGEWLKICKPIYYVFDGIEFDRLVLYTHGDVSVIFKNCQFFDSIILEDVNTVVFENNKHYDYETSRYGIINKVLRGKAKNLKFINDNFYNEDMSYDFGYFTIDLDVENLSVINTKMDIQKFVALKEKKAINTDRHISINANNMIIENSLISATGVCLNCNDLSVTNSNIDGKKEVVINEASNELNLGLVKAPKFIYNDKEVVDGMDTVNEKNNDINVDYSIKNKVDYEKVNEKIVLSRVDLIKSLMRFRNICEEMGIEKSITRTLKR